MDSGIQMFTTDSVSTISSGKIVAQTSTFEQTSMTDDDPGIRIIGDSKVELVLKNRITNEEASIDLVNPNNSSNNAKLQIDLPRGSTSIILDQNKRMGIGNITPEAILHLHNHNNNNSEHFKITNSDSLGLNLVVTTSNTDVKANFGTMWYNSGTTTTVPNALVIRNINGTNRVGIGTSNPGYTLEINGDINFTGNILSNGQNYSSGYVNYSLPTASGSTLGGVKVGTNLSIDSVTGVLSSTDTTYTVTDGQLSENNFTTTLKTKLDNITYGIANDNVVKIDHSSVSDDDYAKFTSSGIEGRSFTEVKTDLSLDNVENTAVSTWAGSTNLVTLGTITTGTWGANVINYNKGGTGYSAYTSGQLLIGNSGGGLSKSTLTAGSNVTITNGNGTITIASTDTTYTVTDGQLSQRNFTTTLKNKLDSIETNADVTDSANVASAGAVMNTGNETIAGTKTFSSTIIGSINGNAATATTAGTVTTAAQPNITSVGTLSSLTVKASGVSSFISEVQNSSGTKVGAWYNTSDGSGQLYIYNHSGGTEKILLHSNGNSYFTGGNVGIGTTSPSYKLDVSGTGRFTGNLTANLIGDVTGNADTATKIASITNSNIVQLTNTQTLTNKTLTSPTITGTGTIAGTFTGNLTGDVTGNADTATKIASITNSNIVQLTDTQTLTNKTLTSPTITGTVTTSGISMGGHLIPTTGDTYDIGSSSKKIRDLYVSDNSLWVGDLHKIQISNGKMKFRKRKNNIVPASILEASGQTVEQVTAAALLHAGKSSLSELNLEHWESYGNTLDVANRGIGNVRLQDIFADNANDYEDDFDSGKIYGIANTNAVQIDNATVSANDYARFTSYGLEGRSFNEVKADLGLNSTSSPSFNNLTLSGNLTVNGDTTTISTTNTTVEDTILELSSGTTGTPANDSGIIIERGDSDNVFMGWDESSDKFIMGSTTATGTSSGNLNITPGTLLVDIEGNASTVTNGVYTTSSVTVLSDVSSAGSGSIITDTERTKLSGIAANANNYSLPTSSTSTLGGVKVDGSTITISDGVISSSPGYTLPTSSTTTLGGVKVDGSTITINGSGVISSSGSILSSSSINELSDISFDTSSITNGQSLVWNSTNNRWEAGSPSLTCSN